MRINILNKLGLVLVLFLSLGACSNQEDSKSSTESATTTTHNEATTTQENTSQAPSLSEVAQQGKAIFPICNACHNPELDPPMAAPMFGVQNRYKRAFPDKQQFVQQVVSFVQHPTKEKALMKRPVKKLGLMPAQTLPEEDLVKVATYIYEETFLAPCTHWEFAIKSAEARGEVDSHIQKDKMKLKRFCAE